MVLADIRMPRLDGLEVTRLLAGPGVAEPMQVVVVTTFDIDRYVHAALRNGAWGFILKRSGPALLTEAVRAAAAGDALISPQVTVRVLRTFRAGLPTSPRTGPPATGHTPAPPAECNLPPLTARETEIARLVAQGRSNAEIAVTLFLSPATVKNHLASIQRKLGAPNRVGIAAWVWNHG